MTSRIARGDPDALGAFYEAWFDRCYALARRLTRRDESFCLDVVQDTMLRVARSMKRLETVPELDRWMTRVVHSAALDRLRQESRRVARERRRHETAPAQEEGDRLDERVRWLREQVASLGAEERTILGLRFVQGQTLDQAGDAIGITGDALHGRIRRILQRLRRDAPEEHEHD